MTLLAQLHSIVFPKIPKVVEGHYKFLVTEIYPNLNPVAYYVEIPDNEVFFTLSVDGGYRISLYSPKLRELQEKIDSLGCEAYIYPRFAVGE